MVTAAHPPLTDIESAVSQLSRSDLTAFRDWFSSFDSQAWDEQFEQDVRAGRLDSLADEALADLHSGRSRAL